MEIFRIFCLCHIDLLSLNIYDSKAISDINELLWYLTNLVIWAFVWLLFHANTKWYANVFWWKETQKLSFWEKRLWPNEEIFPCESSFPWWLLSSFNQQCLVLLLKCALARVLLMNVVEVCILPENLMFLEHKCIWKKLESPSCLAEKEVWISWSFDDMESVTASTMVAAIGKYFAVPICRVTEIFLPCFMNVNIHERAGCLLWFVPDFFSRS